MLGLPRGTEWIVILVIVILLFGPGRIGKIASELGRSIKSFRDGLGGKDDEAETPEQDESK
ncbi:MAG: twin-arginine translocase TatA/TatE family subunit [Anaerolineales bacterium]|jgi:sec-independent protein translocase protein TatA|nr:twin-arginine translocase TatA/TatE family subunit [Anaerolineales bacterium]WKZ38593.1 MAG: twin-arginine translocase TatA/TatE family subunit [Anaerolineales bacterium]